MVDLSVSTLQWSGVLPIATWVVKKFVTVSSRRWWLLPRTVLGALTQTTHDARVDGNGRAGDRETGTEGANTRLFCGC